MSRPSKCSDDLLFLVAQTISEYGICGVPLRWPSGISPEYSEPAVRSTGRAADTAGQTRWITATLSVTPT